MLSLTGMLVAFWLVALGLGVLVMRHELDEVFDSALQETAERLLALTVDDLELRQQADGLEIESLNRSGRREYLVYQVRDPSGRLLLKSDDAPSTVIQPEMDKGFSDTTKYRVFTSVSPDGKLILQVADRFSNRREAVRESAVTMLIPLLLLIPASIVSIWLVIGRALKPIGALRQAIATKDGGNMAPLEEAHLPEELTPIAHSVNLLLERLRNAFAAEREFTANSAHELRTPIAGALAQTQRLVEELPDGPAKVRARKIEKSLRDLGHLAEKLLQLARAESGIGSKETEVDLLQVLAIVVLDLQRVPGLDRKVELRHPHLKSMPRRVDVDAFGIVMRNLIENAFLHGDSTLPVLVEVTGDHSVSVTNACDIVQEHELSGLKNRFRRGRTSASGTGLGLAIADRIVIEMGGKLTLFSPARGRIDGFEALVELSR
ncbi:sensor histidine kinase [Rhizobium sp. Leaf384]|uniref:sensor histidine kinase n=1 Tax=Rhizobium sp. Leaf384 TaxID=1736358 RepID=UPI001FCE2395|nr:sensor histidine kinase [Rhizobium sp. Leaf384]